MGLSDIWPGARLPMQLFQDCGSNSLLLVGLGRKARSRRHHLLNRGELPPEEMLRPFARELSAVLITQIVPRGPADEAGVKPGDIIIALDNKAVDERHDLSRLIRNHEPGDEVLLTVLRRGAKTEMTQIEVTLGRDRGKEGEVVPYLGIWYEPVGAGMCTTPYSRDPWD